jgi:hypothetical protein
MYSNAPRCSLSSNASSDNAASVSLSALRGEFNGSDRLRRHDYLEAHWTVTRSGIQAQGWPARIGRMCTPEDPMAALRSLFGNLQTEIIIFPPAATTNAKDSASLQLSQLMQSTLFRRVSHVFRDVTELRLNFAQVLLHIALSNALSPATLPVASLMDPFVSSTRPLTWSLLMLTYASIDSYRQAAGTPNMKQWENGKRDYLEALAR